MGQAPVGRAHARAILLRLSGGWGRRVAGWSVEGRAGGGQGGGGVAGHVPLHVGQGGPAAAQPGGEAASLGNWSTQPKWISWCHVGFVFDLKIFSAKTISFALFWYLLDRMHRPDYGEKRVGWLGMTEVNWSSNVKPFVKLWGSGSKNNLTETRWNTTPTKIVFFSQKCLFGLVLVFNTVYFCFHNKKSHISSKGWRVNRGCHTPGKMRLFFRSTLLFSPVRGRVTMGRWEAGARHGEVEGALVRLFWDRGNRSETVLGGGRVLLCYYGQQTLLELSNSYTSPCKDTVLRGWAGGC